MIKRLKKLFNPHKPSAERIEEDPLFMQMEKNAIEYYGNQTFWRELHEVSRELTPNCISVEPFNEEMAYSIASGRPTNKEFLRNEKTVVIRLKNKETALQAADLLNNLFNSTGTHFVAEIPEGSDTPQIRSNIDKQHASHLSVISKFFFDREITNPDERKVIHDECKKIVAEYVKNTKHEQVWKARTGVLPFASLAGLPGNLRPLDPPPFDPEKKLHELKGNGRKNSVLFKDVVFFVDIDKNGDIWCLKYDPFRHAYSEAQGGVGVVQWLQEVGGGAVWSEEKISPAVKALRTTGLIIGIKEAVEGIGELLIGSREGLQHLPNIIILGTVSGITFGVDIARQSYKNLREITKVRERIKWLHEHEHDRETTPVPPEAKAEPAKVEEPVDPAIAYGYTRGHAGDDDENQKKGFVNKIIKGNGHPSVIPRSATR